jgi:hypothetical protein
LVLVLLEMMRARFGRETLAGARGRGIIGGSLGFVTFRHCRAGGFCCLFVAQSLPGRCAAVVIAEQWRSGGDAL